MVHVKAVLLDLHNVEVRLAVGDAQVGVLFAEGLAHGQRAELAEYYPLAPEIAHVLHGFQAVFIRLPRVAVLALIHKRISQIAQE